MQPWQERSPVLDGFIGLGVLGVLRAGLGGLEFGLRRYLTGRAYLRFSVRKLV